jgi:hypothetical protein
MAGEDDSLDPVKLLTSNAEMFGQKISEIFIETVQSHKESTKMIIEVGVKIQQTEKLSAIAHALQNKQKKALEEAECYEYILTERADSILVPLKIVIKNHLQSVKTVLLTEASGNAK